VTAVWQLAKRLVFGRGERPRTVWFGVGRGCRFVIDPAHKSQRIVGLDEAELAAGFRRNASRARTFIDVGASDGYYPVVALRLNPSLTAVGCEPQTDLERRAWENYRLTFPAGGPRMEWVAKPVGDGPGQVALDDLAAGRPGPVFVKIDVDGGEVGVLRSGPGVLARADCALLVEVHSRPLEEGCVEGLRAAGYHCRVIPNAWWRRLVPEHRPIGWNRWVAADRLTA
jgi:methyltransferase FkbM-like protein